MTISTDAGKSTRQWPRTERAMRDCWNGRARRALHHIQGEQEAAPCGCPVMAPSPRPHQGPWHFTSYTAIPPTKGRLPAPCLQVLANGTVVRAACTVAWKTLALWLAVLWPWQHHWENTPGAVPMGPSRATQPAVVRVSFPWLTSKHENHDLLWKRSATEHFCGNNKMMPLDSVHGDLKRYTIQSAPHPSMGGERELCKMSLQMKRNNFSIVEF